MLGEWRLGFGFRGEQGNAVGRAMRKRNAAAWVKFVAPQYVREDEVGINA